VVLGIAALIPHAAVKADPAPGYLYTKAFDLVASADSNTNAVATDSSNSTYVTGDYQGTVTFDGSGGSDTHTTGNSHPATFITKRAADGTYTWTKIVDASAGFTETHGVAVGPSDELYVAGLFYGTVIFDGVGGTHSITSANPAAFLTKFNSNGTYAWTNYFDSNSGGGGSATAYGVSVDDAGNVYIGGRTFGDIVYDGPGGTHSISASQNAFVTKYSSGGTYAWTSSFDAATTGAVQVFGFTTDANGNSYLTGYVDGAVTFGGSDSVNLGNQSSFLVKYNTSGAYQFVRTFDIDNFGSGGYASSYAVETDSSGNIYFGGSFTGDIIFDGPGGTHTGSAAAAICAYVTKYNSDGTYGWTKYVDNTNGEATVGGLVADTTGNIYAVGGFQGDVIFDGAGGGDTQSDQSSDIFDNAYITQYEASNGAYGWTKSFDSTNGIAGGQAAAVDSNNFVYMAGYAADTIVFDGVGGSDSRTFSNGFRASFITKYNTGTLGGSPGTDSDSDGIADSIEDAGPNGGDANNDGIADSTQNNVASFLNSVAKVYEVLTVTPCQLTATTSVVPESDNAVQDSGYNYPFGLTNFHLSCTTPGSTAQFTLYLYDQTTAGLVVRKYYPSTSAYNTVTGASIGQRTIAGHNVLVASYQLTDGGALDTDGAVNSAIVDPAGLALPVVGAPNTGLGGTAAIIL